jgi:hypothetical protein
MPAQSAFYLFLNIPAHKTCHTTYISHTKGVLWYTQGYIPDTSPRGCGGLVESCIGFNTNIPKSQNSYAHEADMLACPRQILSHAIIGNVLLDIYLICWLLWVISKYYCAFFGYIDTLPLGLCFIDIVCFDNAGILLCLLWLHRYFTS